MGIKDENQGLLSDNSDEGGYEGDELSDLALGGSPAPVPRSPFTVENLTEIFPEKEFVVDGRAKLTVVVIANILNDIANHGRFYAAAAAAGISEVHFHRYKKEDERFQEVVTIALEMYRERIASAVHNRGIEGWLEPVFFQGERCGFIRKFSDRLLEMHAKRYCPEYREKREINVNHNTGVLLVRAPAINTEDWLEAARKVKRVKSTVLDDAEPKPRLALPKVEE